jgi:hypothetical protein
MASIENMEYMYSVKPIRIMAETKRSYFTTALYPPADGLQQDFS